MTINMRVICVVGLGLTTSLAVAQEAVQGKWKSFKSSNGFSVKYPGNWFRKGISTDSVTILSSSGGAEGLIIKRGQAMIFVKKDEKYTNSTLSQMIDQYAQDTEVLFRKDIRNDMAGPRGCHKLKQIISREAAVPPEGMPGSVPYMLNTEYFCEIHGHKYVTVLRTFESDRKQATYQKIALRVAESLRANK